MLDEIVDKLMSSFVGCEIKILEELTEGQAITRLEGLEGLAPDRPLTIGACDNGVLFDVDRFQTMMDDPEIDVIVWTIRGHADGTARPQMFGWVDADETGSVRGVSVKQPLSDPANDPMIIGAFTFKRAGDF